MSARSGFSITQIVDIEIISVNNGTSLEILSKLLFLHQSNLELDSSTNQKECL